MLLTRKSWTTNLINGYSHKKGTLQEAPFYFVFFREKKAPQEGCSILSTCPKNYFLNI